MGRDRGRVSLGALPPPPPSLPHLDANHGRPLLDRLHGVLDLEEEGGEGV